MSAAPDQYIQHVNVMVEDMDAAAEFYAGFLGLEQVTPPQNQGFPCEFFRFNDHQEVHVNVLPDPVPVKAHFALRVPNFEEIVRGAIERGCLETETWGKVRRMPHGVMQGFIRDPSGNLIELTAVADQPVSDEFFELDEVDPEPGMFVLEGATSE